MQRNTLLILALVALLTVALPEIAHAWTPTTPTDPINVCKADGGDYTGFTRRIVLCVQNTVLSAMYALLGPLFQAFYAVVGACVTLAVAFWGIQMATGQQGWQARRGIGLAVKAVVLVILFGASGHNFVFFYTQALDFLNELLGAVTGYVNFSQSLSCNIPAASNPAMVVWDRVDCAINTIIGGVLNNSNVGIGIGGFLLAALLGGGPGLFVALLGFMIVIQLLFAVIRALYIYILSYVAFSLMALVAPIFLPMLMFKTTQGYFEKWLKLTTGFILQPIFLFVYLAMLLAAYDVVVYTGSGSLYNTFMNGQCSASNCPAIGDWLRNNNVYEDKLYGKTSININVDNATGPETCDAAPVPTAPPDCDTPDIVKDNAGTANNLPEVPTTEDNWKSKLTNSLQKNVYTSLNIDDYFFHVNVPVPTINWDALTAASGASDTEDLIIKLLTSLFMAVSTTYIFLHLLDMMPFIGSGVANIGSFVGGGSGMSGFGFGNLAPPGAGMVNNLRKKISG